MPPKLHRKEHGHRDPKKDVPQHELDAAERLAAKQESPAELGALLEDSPHVLERLAAERRLWETTSPGRFLYVDLWEADPQLLERVMANEPYEWIYDGIMRSVPMLGQYPDVFEVGVAALSRVARQAPSELRRRLALKTLAGIRDDAVDPPYEDKKAMWEPALSHALLHDESNFNRVQIASAIRDTPYRFSDQLVEFARQWLLHTKLARPSKEPGWKKINGYFAKESAPLLNPNWNPGPASFPVDGAEPPAQQTKRAPDSADRAPSPAAHPQSGGVAHVTIEHTKKSIKAQGVLARALFVVGIAMFFVDTANRFQLAIGIMALAVFWLTMLRVWRWWQHA